MLTTRYYSPYATFEELSGAEVGAIPAMPFLSDPGDIDDVIKLQRRQITLQAVNTTLMSVLIFLSIIKLLRS